jgi:hypothetical protein
VCDVLRVVEPEPLPAKAATLGALGLRALQGVPALHACIARADSGALGAWGEVLTALCLEGDWVATVAGLGSGVGAAAAQPSELGALPLATFRFALAAADAGAGGGTCSLLARRDDGREAGASTVGAHDGASTAGGRAEASAAV